MLLCVMLIWLLLFWPLALITHEAGHVLAASLLRIRVHSVGIGLGPTIASWQPSPDGPVWNLGLLPIGGYTHIADARGPELAIPAHGHLLSRPWSHRALVIMAGALCNLIVCMLAIYTNTNLCAVVILPNLYLVLTSALPLRNSDASRLLDSISTSLFLSKQEQAILRFTWSACLIGGAFIAAL